METNITNEEYYVQSYGQEEFLTYFDKYYHREEGEEVPEVIAIFIYELLNQLDVFVLNKNFILNFEAGRFTVLNTWIRELCKEHYKVEPQFEHGLQVRIIGTNTNTNSNNLIMQVIPSNENTTYNFVLGEFGAVPPLVNSDFIRVPDTYKGKVVAKDIRVGKLVIEDSEFVGERDRSIIAYNGTNYQHVDQEIVLALNGYNTGQIEKMIYTFSEYDATAHEGVDSVVKTYITHNNSSQDIYDGFYDTNMTICATKNKAMGEDMITKAFNLNVDGTLSGLSSNDASTNRIVLRSVTVVIDQKYWGLNDSSKVEKLKEYKTLSVKEITPGVNKVYMVDENNAVDIYNMSKEELDEFNNEFSNK